MDCPLCNRDMNVIDFYQDVPVGNKFYQSWHYQCPKCGKKYVYTEYWRLENDELEEEMEEEE